MEENTILCFLPGSRRDAGFVRAEGFAEERETVFRPRVRPFCAIARILARIAYFGNARRISETGDIFVYESLFEESRSENRLKKIYRYCRITLSGTGQIDSVAVF